MTGFVDTHCHIHTANQSSGDRMSKQLWKKHNQTIEQLIESAHETAVRRMICVGCDVDDSDNAIQTARMHTGLSASIGIHPHEAQRYVQDTAQRARFAQLATDDQVVAVGECGLDYFYAHSPKASQVAILEFQLQLAMDNDLPVILHVREAFDDFWPIFDGFSGLRGVVHSFTDNRYHLDQALKRELYIGVNGIATFAKDPDQIAMYTAIPLDRLVLETDAPYLTPVPFRGKICEPKYVATIAAHLAASRGESLESIRETTTQNATKLFSL